MALGALTNRIETALVLPVIVTSAEGKVRLGPNYLGSDLEPAGLEAFGDLAGKEACVPNICQSPEKCA
jgi:hypothetical protein